MNRVLTTLLILNVLKVFATDYYVNDNDASGDIYCSAVGNIANTGLSAASPLPTLTDVIAIHGPSGSGMIAAGDNFYIDAGVYYQTDVNLSININNISIIGAGYDLTIFDHDFGGGDLDRWATITGDGFNLSGVYITGYDYGVGGASALQISGASGVTITNVMVNENFPGGGSSSIVIDGGSSVDFIGGGSNCNPGHLSVAGGGVNIEGNGNTVTFTDYTFSFNKKDYQGGSGLYISGDNSTSVTVSNSVFSNNENYAAQGGGAVYVSGANLTMSGTCFTNNFISYSSGPVYGGAICIARGATLNVSDCSFNGNYAETSGKGGAIGINTSYAGAGSTAEVTISNSSFSGNSSGEGTDLYARVGSSNPAIFNVDQCTFSGTGLDIRDDNTAQINIQNSGSPNATGAGINFINTTPSTVTPATNCPTIIAPCFSVLPVEFIEFRGECMSNNELRLQWSSASELNNDYFSLFGANEMGQWNELIKHDGMGTTQSITNYEVFLRDVGYTYFKLDQVDYNGEITELAVISLKERCINTDVDAFFDAMNFSLALTGEIEEEGNYEFTLYNSMGQVVLSEIAFLNTGVLDKEIRINNENVVSGIYYLKMLGVNTSLSFKLSIQF